MEKQLTTVQLGGMDCNHCVSSVEKNVGAIENVEEARADLKTQYLQLKGNNINLQRIKETIESLGYSYHGKI
jgi:copper chaperone CopZ